MELFNCYAKTVIPVILIQIEPDIKINFFLRPTLSRKKKYILLNDSHQQTGISAEILIENKIKKTYFGNDVDSDLINPNRFSSLDDYQKSFSPNIIVLYIMAAFFY